MFVKTGAHKLTSILKRVKVNPFSEFKNLSNSFNKLDAFEQNYLKVCFIQFHAISYTIIDYAVYILFKQTTVEKFPHGESPLCRY